LRVEAQAATVVREEDGLRPSTAEKEAEPVSHTVMPLNVGASTHRWARAMLRGLAATLARRLPVLTCSVQSREDRERRRGRGSRWRCLLEDAVTSGLLAVRPSVFSSCWLRRGVKNVERLNGARVPEPMCAEVLFSQESCTAVRSE
jgi:hypothetical protein